MNPNYMLPFVTKPVRAFAAKVDRNNAEAVAKQLSSENNEIVQAGVVINMNELQGNTASIIFRLASGRTIEMQEGDYVIDDERQGLISMVPAAFEDTYTEAEVV